MYEEDQSMPSHPLDTDFMTSYTKPNRKSFFTPFMKVAAILMLIVTTSVTTAIFVSNGYVSAVKDSIDKKVFQWKYGIHVSTDQDEFIEEEETLWEITDKKTFSKLKELIPEFKIPSYIPKGYTFQELRLHQFTDGTFSGEYEYEQNNQLINILCFSVDGEDTAVSAINGDTIKLKDRIITYWDDPVAKTSGASVIFDQTLCQITIEEGLLDRNTIIEIAKSLS